ncbi:MAG: hypothetical protein ACRD16_17125 [Thermoanaerobaculia bacterium]
MIRSFRDEVFTRARKSLKRHWPVAFLLAGWWFSHRVTGYPVGYLWKVDREIWILQLGSWLSLVLETAILIAALAAAASLTEVAFDRAERTGPTPGSRGLEDSGKLAPRKAPVLFFLKHLLGISAVLSPFVVCVLAGCTHASVWLDEISYWYYEKSPKLRGAEWGRPGSGVAQLFSNFFYCDIQRLVHSIVSPFGLTLQVHPELFLRCFSLLSFVTSVVLIYVWLSRETDSWWWAVAGTMAFSASPLFLFYAFEARVYAFATLLVLVELILLKKALRAPQKTGYQIVGALLGVLLVHLHVWVICLFAAIFLVGAIRYFYVRGAAEGRVVAAFTVPAGLVGGVETAAILLTQPHRGYPFPLFLPHPFSFVLERTVAGAFSVSAYMPPWLRPLPWLPIPLILVGVSLTLVAWESRRSPRLIFPVASVLALGISVEIGGRMGFLVAPRYQVPLFGALFFALAGAASKKSRLGAALVAVLELTVLAQLTIPDILGKGNGRQISAEIEAATPRSGTAIVIQHELRLGYPDPLHNFVVDFYLNELRPEQPPFRLLELPRLNDITGTEGVQQYFGGGPPLRAEFASRPTLQWQRWLGRSSYDRIWFISAVPAIGLERSQIESFLAALGAGGFCEDRRHGTTFGGYPTTRLRLFVRCSVY